jgi:hypothetical protein
MKEFTTIRIEKSVHKKLYRLRGLMMYQDNKKYTLSDAISKLCKFWEEN